MALSKEQLIERRKYLGGSDSAAVLGLSRFSTPLQVWAEKTGKLNDEYISDRLYIKMGERLEQVVAELFTEETGKGVRRVNETIFHPQYPFLAANIDRRIVGEDSILECKTASGWKAKEWEENEVPQEYIIQCLHYLAVTGKKEAYIAVLIGGNQKFVYKKIERDEKLIQDIIAKEVHFWNTFIIPDVMPVQITKNDADTLYNLFPQEQEGKEIELNDDANILVESLQAMKQDAKVLDGQIAKTENELKALLKDNAIGKSGLWQVTWKEQIRKSFTVAEGKSRVLRIKSLAKKESK